jgi:ectoine hydroxylase-related dioxygenase (phytanoyl-CoA dioxygenase family)
MNTQYNTRGWVQLTNILSEEEVHIVKTIGEQMRIDVSKYSTWKGISCASKFDETLYKMYTNNTMYKLSRDILGEVVYLFNDQVVIKLPNDTLDFVAHYDNQYGPNSDGTIHTVNICWILDDFTEDNGGLDVKNQDDGEWVKLYPKRGDVVAINGNTYHRSGTNRTNKSRGLYACVYSEQPIQLDGFYNNKFE